MELRKSVSKQQMATLLGISKRTFYRRLQAHDIEYNRSLLTPVQQAEILLKLGYIFKLEQYERFVDGRLGQ